MYMRPFQRNDLENCIALFKDVFSRPPWNDEWTDETANAYFAEFIHAPGFIGYIVIDETSENPVVAAIIGRSRTWWKGKEYFIDEFYVRADRQGQGIGTKLLEYVHHDLGERGIHTVVLLTSHHAPAYHFYQNRGYQENNHIRFMYKHNHPRGS